MIQSPQGGAPGRAPRLQEIPPAADPIADRKNGNLFLCAYLASFFAAPICYVDVTEAALCHKLGASATVANLPSAGYVFASFAPIVAACIIPHRWERRTVVATGGLISLSLASVALALILPCPNQIRIFAIIGQALVMGLLSSVGGIFILQCLGRGTTPSGRGRALKLTFAFSPLSAVAGSLFAQFVLHGGIRPLHFPRDFALLYLVAAPCIGFSTLCYSRFRLRPLADESQPPFFPSLWESFGRFLRSPSLSCLWLAFLLWNIVLLVMPNLSLFSKQAMGRDPAEFSGAMVAIQFGAKALAGYGLGVLYVRRGLRAPLIATVALLGLAIVWAWTVSGYAYLGAFALIGAGQLGGIYFPNVLLTWSPSATTTRDLAVLSLATVAASPAPALHGALADRWGFHASFLFGIASAAIALGLVFRLRAPSEAGTRLGKFR